MGKYLKLFNEMSQYEAFKGGEEYILPNVSYVENSTDVLFNPLQYIKNGVILAKFNATDDNKLAIANTSNIKSLKINGVEVSFTQQTYYFDEIGEYDVEIELIDNSLINGVVWDDNYNLLSNSMFTDANNWIGACLTSIVIPDSVTTIGEDAFGGCSGLTSVIIPDSVTTIGEGAFVRCSGLTSVTIPDSVTTIGDSAFYECSSLTSVHIGSGVTTIGEGAFVRCSGLTSVHIGSGVTTIGSGAFAGCSELTSIIIPDSVTTIGEEAFGGCSGLTSVHIGSGVTTIEEYAFPGCSSLNEITCLAPTAPSIYNSTFKDIASNGTLKVPVGGGYRSWMSTDNYYLGKYNWTVEYIDDNQYVNPIVCTYNVTDISQETQISHPYSLPYMAYMIVDGVEMDVDGYYQFDTIGNHVVEFVLDDPTTMGGVTFQYCNNLISVVIPDSVITIGDYAFGGCSELTSIIIPDSVTTIGNYAFNDCSGLTSITIPDSVITIGNSAFGGCSGLTSIIIPDSVTTIGDSAFYDCSGLTSVHIGSGVTTIGWGAFYNCSGLTSIIIPDSVTTIGTYVFYDCTSLTSVHIGSGVTTIGQDAFGGCSGLTSVHIGSSVTTIESGAFYDCSSLTSITIPDSVTTISAAFGGCTNLSEITCNAITAPTINSYTFHYVKSGGILKVPAGSDYSSWMSTNLYYLGYHNWTIEYI